MALGLAESALVPAALLNAIPLAYSALLRNQVLVFIEIPGLRLTVEQIAKLLRERTFGLRITILQLMIAVSLLCYTFGSRSRYSDSPSRRTCDPNASPCGCGGHIPGGTTQRRPITTLR